LRVGSRSEYKHNPKASKVLGFFYPVKDCHGIRACDQPPSPDCNEGAIGVARADAQSAFGLLLASFFQNTISSQSDP
jgi:hypothetical protein